MSFLKLVNFEIRRFAKIYGVLVLLAVGLQLIGTVVVSRGYVAKVLDKIKDASLTLTQFAKSMNYDDKLDFTYILKSMWTYGAIAVCICALIFYVFFIWYRDWFSSNAFIYRLLMLPAARMNLYLSKTAAILLMTIGLVGIEILILPIEFHLFHFIVPEPLRNDFPLADSISRNRILMFLIPASLSEFIALYGIGVMGVLAVFTAILFERSFKWRGAIIGVAYCCATIGVLAVPIFTPAQKLLDRLYTSEMVLLELSGVILSIVISLWLSRFLLNKKVTV